MSDSLSNILQKGGIDVLLLLRVLAEFVIEIPSFYEEPFGYIEAMTKTDSLNDFVEILKNDGQRAVHENGSTVGELEGRPKKRQSKRK